MNKKYRILLSLFALLLVLLTACGGENDVPPAPSPAPAGTEEQTPPTVSDPAPMPDEVEPEPAGAPAPSGTDPAGEEPDSAAVQPDDPAPESSVPSEPAPEPEQEPEPEPVPDQEPAETVPEDGTYTAAVTLEGGTGRATVASPAVLRCENGQFWATIVWSSSNFDYMKVDGEKYMQTNTEGNSTFEIPVSAFDQRLDVIADTVAMSEPHEVEYTLLFDASTLEKQ